MLQIVVNDIELDLYPGEIFTLTLQATDLISLTGVKANFTKTISVPVTPTNSQALGSSHILASQSTHPYKSLRALIIQNGTQLFTNGKCIIESANDIEYRITIYSGNINIVELLSGISIQDLDIDTDFNFTLDNAESRKNNSSGVVWNILSINNLPLPVYDISVDIAYNYFSVYLKDIIQAAFDHFEVVVEGLDDLTTPPLEELVIPLVNRPRVTDLFREQRGFIASSSINRNYNTTDQNLIFNVVEGNIADEFDPNPTGAFYQSAECFEFTARVKLVCTKTGTNGPAIFSLQTGGATTGHQYFYEEIDASATTFTVEFEVVGMYKGFSDSLVLKLQLTAGDTVTVLDESIWEFECNEFARTNENTGGTQRGGLIDVSKSLPDISAWDVIRTIRSMYMALMAEDRNSGVARLLKLEKIDDIAPGDLSDSLDTSKPELISYRSEALAQINKFEWMDDGELIHDHSGLFSIRDQNLPPLRTTISDVFAASDDELLDTGIFAGVIPLWEEEEVVTGEHIAGNISASAYSNIDLDNVDGIRMQDVLIIQGVACTITLVNRRPKSPGFLVEVYSESPINFVAGQTYRVVRPSALSPAPRIMQVRDSTRSITMNNGQSETSDLNPYKVINFRNLGEGINLGWGQLLQDNYALFVNRLQQEKILNCSLNLSEAQIANFDFLRLYYIEKYNNYFYVNKLNKWRNDRSTPAILLAFNFGFGGNEISQWTNDGFDPYTTFSSERNRIRRAVNTSAVLARALGSTLGIIDGELYEAIYTLEFNGTPQEVIAYFERNSDSAKISNTGIIQEGENKTPIKVTGTGESTFILETNDIVDYNITLRLEKVSAGGGLLT